MVMIDTSIWVALLNKMDSTHYRAKDLIRNSADTDYKIYDYIYSETMTILKGKVSHESCIEFLKIIGILNLPIMLSTQEAFSLASSYFLQHKKLSFTDCLLMASAKLENASLLTFDRNLKKAWDAL